MASSGQAAAQQKCRKVVMAIHGAGGGGWEFNRWRWAFEAAGWRFHAPDLLPVAAGIEATRWADYSAQLSVLMQDLRPSVLIGASLGGLLALECAAGHVLDAVVLINPLPPAPLAALLPPSDWPARVPWAQRHDLRSTRRALARSDPATVWYANQRWRDESGAVLRAAHAGIALAPLRTRTLLIAGALDNSVPVAISRQLALQLAADYLELAQADHLDPLFGSSCPAAISAALAFPQSPRS